MQRTPWLSWRLYFLTIPVDIVVVIFLSSNTLISFENAPRWFLVGLTAHAALAPFIAIGVWLNSKFNTWKSDISILITLGAIRGLAIVWCEKAFDLSHAFSDLYRVFNSSIAVPTWFIFLSIIFEARRQYKNEFKNLFQKAVKEARSGQYSSDGSAEPNLSTEDLILRLQSLTLSLAEEMRQALTMPISRSEFADNASKIQNLVNTELRPTSAQLWHGSSIRTPKVFLKDFFSITLMQSNLPITQALFYTIPYLFIGTFGAFGLLVALIQIAVSTVPLIFTSVIFEKLHTKRRLTRRATNLSILGLSLLFSVLLQHLLVNPEIQSNNNFLSSFVFQLVLWLVLLIVLIGINLYNSVRTQRQAVLVSFESLLTNKRYLNLIAADLKPISDIEMARYLHGEIQTGLTATSLLLQQASKSGDATLAREALERAVKILSQDHKTEINKSVLIPSLYLKKIVTGWRGIADIHIELDFINQLTPDKAHDVVELIGEGITNAIRHGRATKISVSGNRELKYVQIDIDSNGLDSTNSESGLGTKMFNELASDWNLMHASGQNHLTFTILTN